MMNFEKQISVENKSKSYNFWDSSLFQIEFVMAQAQLDLARASSGTSVIKDGNPPAFEACSISVLLATFVTTTTTKVSQALS